MRKLLTVFLFVLLFAFSFITPPSVSAAGNCTLGIQSLPISGSSYVSPETLILAANDVTLDGNPLSDNTTNDIFLHVWADGLTNQEYFPLAGNELNNGVLEVNITNLIYREMIGDMDVQNKTVYIQLEKEAGIVDTLICSTNISVTKQPMSCGALSVLATRSRDDINLAVTAGPGSFPSTQTYTAYFTIPGWMNQLQLPLERSGDGRLLAGIIQGRYPDGNYKVVIDGSDSEAGADCETTFNVVKTSLPPADGDNPPPAQPGDPIPEYEAEPFNLCAQIPNASSRARCQTCLASSGIWTAVGCINFENNGANIIKTLITLGLSLGGGFTLLIILFAGFTLSTSQGDPKRVSEAKELITSAVIGLLFIIFSVTILQFIGVSLFKIPGFGG